MMRRRKNPFLLIGSLFISSFCMAQEWRIKTDSLLKAGQQAGTPVQKVKYLTEAAFIFLLQNPDTAMLLNNEAESIAAASGNDTALAMVYAGKSAVYLIRDNNAMTLEYALKGLTISERTPLPPDVLAAIYRKLGYVYRNNNQFTKCIEAYKKALVYSEASNNRYDMATTSSNIGNIFNSFKQYDSALVYHAKTLEFARAGNYKDIIARTYIQIINSYNALKQYERSFQAVADMRPYLVLREVTPLTKGLAYTKIASLDMQHGPPPHKLAAMYLDSMKRLMATTSPGNDNLIEYYLNRALLEFSRDQYDSASHALEKYHELKKCGMMRSSAAMPRSWMPVMKPVKKTPR
ncbi:tetratricopeptide repeat protein [Longitalea arenae]|uniref:tetratricopeptide repeat protein n=1 Tax=Longitalea arenae TaxID=2812558 RepID=UPI0019681C8B|nr:tetratricopeptide repeat protein [Longitalea arenae]